MSMVSTGTPTVIGMNADVWNDWLNKRFSKNPANGDHTIKKKRCLTVGGRDIACVQDTAKVNTTAMWIAAGVVIVLLARR